MADASVAARYRALVSTAPMEAGCWIWLGALSGQGTGRFWIGAHSVVVAHRFGYALAFGVQALDVDAQLAHRCDEASCQNPAHLRPVSAAENTQEWINRRQTPGSPLRDVRGALGRARALRTAARAGLDLDAAAHEGRGEVDLYQRPLPGI